MADCVAVKIDSNVTGLSFAEEVCPKQLPTLGDDGFDPKWFELEPNEYDDSFGGDNTNVARSPINASRQNKKGTTVDFDASAGFQQDFTQRNFNRLLQGFFFADVREKTTTRPMNGDVIEITGVVAATDHYAAAAGLGVFRAGQLVYVTGCSTAANNGLKLVTAATDNTLVVDADLTDETPTGDVTITVVGEGFGAGAVAMTVAGAIGTLELQSAPVAATAVLAINATMNADPDETVTIGGVVYTFKAAAAAANEVTIGSSRLQTITNLVATINGGSVYTDAHPDVTATDDGDGEMTVTAKIAGTVGNSIETDTDMAEGAWDGDLSGGTGLSMLSLGLAVGEWVYLGGDDAITVLGDNAGYARIGALTNTTISFDKTTFDATAQAAGTTTLQLFAGSFYRNEDDTDLIVTRTYQFERTLGNDGDGTQAEYIAGAAANELTLNGDLADKLTADLGYIALDQETRTGSDGLKAGVRYGALDEDAYNTSTDMVRALMHVIDTADSNPTALFGYVTEMELSINNNLSATKVLGNVGGIAINVGNFVVEGSVTALFSTVRAIRSIRQNADVTFDAIFAKANAGFVWDIPLLSLGGGSLNITANEPITIPLVQMAAKNPAGYTLSYTNFEYLPTAAMPE